MQRYKFFVSLALCLFISQFGDNASAQTLYKYTDKDGKISYSDRVPKPGEKAELVTTDLETIIMAAPKNTVGGVKQTIQDVNARGKQRALNRDKLLKEVLGETFMNTFMAVKTSEVDAFAGAKVDYELQF